MKGRRLLEKTYDAVNGEVIEYTGKGVVFSWEHRARTMGAEEIAVKLNEREKLLDQLNKILMVIGS
jgi:hypothetical protein